MSALFRTAKGALVISSDKSDEQFDAQGIEEAAAPCRWSVFRAGTADQHD